MSVDERLVRSTSLFVVDLEGVGEDKRAVVLGKVLELGLGKVLREDGVELLLSNLDRLLKGDGRSGGRSLLGLEERRTEGRDPVGLVESDVRNRVGEGDAIQLLLDVDVARGFTLEGGADVNSIGLDTSAGLDEGRCGFLDRRIRTLGQRVVDTLPEGLGRSYTSQ